VLKLRYLALAVCVLGCTAVQQRKDNPCKGLEPGGIRITNVRPDSSGVFGNKKLAMPWVSQSTVFTQRAEQPTQVCDHLDKGVCVKSHPEYICTNQTESPSSSDLMNMLSSPISTALSRFTVAAPVIP
jgi:hypothetical protein